MEKELVLEEGNIKAYIIQDEDPGNPFTEWDQLGSLVTWHSRYTLGHEDGEKVFGTPEDFENRASEGKFIMLPVYLMDHSGLSISTRAYGCPWDSGQVGYIYVTPEKVREEYKEVRGKKISEKVENLVLQVLKDEIKTLDMYLTEDVWGVVIEKEVTCGECEHMEPEHLDSCWGFYGYEYTKEEAKRMFDYQLKEHGEGVAA